MAILQVYTQLYIVAVVIQNGTIYEMTIKFKLLALRKKKAWHLSTNYMYTSCSIYQLHQLLGRNVSSASK